MGRIIVLDENTSNKIAAGEVVEKPASVVKELVENSIDAGSTSISVEIKNGGISLIKVTDNGNGMEEDDVEIAFERHATSKIKRAEDLDSIITMGFRGEALASIASVASVELQTKTANSTYGMYVHICGGEFKEVRPTGCPVGTTFIIRDLFYNTPARYKFLKKDSTEAGYISDTISRIALGNPDIAFKFINNKALQIHTPGNNDLKSSIYSIYGKEIVKELISVDYEDERFKISGYIGKPEAARSNRNYQSLYINKRYIKSKLVSYAVEQAYSSILMKNKFPFFVLNIELNPQLVDANVHPAKMDVRFADESYLSRALYMAISKALSSDSLFNPVSVSNKDRELFKFKDVEPKPEYIQEQLNYQAGSNIQQAEVLAPKDKNISINTSADIQNIKNSGISGKNSFSEDNNAEIRLFTKALEPLARTDLKAGSEQQRNADTIANGTYSDNIHADTNCENQLRQGRDNSSVAGDYMFTKQNIGTDIIIGNKSDSNQASGVADEYFQDTINESQVPFGKLDNNFDALLHSEDEVLGSTAKDTVNGYIHADRAIYSETGNTDSVSGAEANPDYSVMNGQEKAVCEFAEMKYIGQAFSTYIMLQNGEELVLVDQHAAHERILYEKLKIKYESQENTTQLLLEPVVIQLQAYELDVIKSKEELFNRIGFLFEDFGNNSIIIRGIPYLIEGYSPKEIFLELADKLQDSVKPITTPIADEIIHTVACKAAIKANKKLNDKEVYQLLNELSNTGRKYTCPHGRPTVVRLTKYEIEKMFKRIV